MQWLISYKLLVFGHRSLIKNITQTAMINILNHAFYELDVSYASQHTFSKVFLKTSMSTSERRILNISALTLLAQSVRLLSFCIGFTIHTFSSLLYTSQVYSFNYSSRSVCLLKLKGVTSVVGCVKCVPLPVKRKKTG